MAAFKPSYLKLYRNGDLNRRAKELWNILSDCRLCAHHCGVNRLAGDRGFCRAPSRVVYSSALPHGGEEFPLSGQRGSGTVFFTYCNSRCLFCQNYDISQLAQGAEISIEDLAEIYLALQQKGCHNVNWVSPSHFLPHAILALEMAVENGFCLPLVYNTNGYDDLDILKLLDGIVDIYLPDMKFGDASVARRLTRMQNYPEINKIAVKEMYRQVGLLQTDNGGIALRGLIIRHLVLPHNMSGSDLVLKNIAAIDNRLHVNLMAQYYPAYRAPYIDGLDRRLAWDEYRQAIKLAETYQLNNVWTQQLFFSSIF